MEKKTWIDKLLKSSKDLVTKDLNPFWQSRQRALNKALDMGPKKKISPKKVPTIKKRKSQPRTVTI